MKKIIKTTAGEALDNVQKIARHDAERLLAHVLKTSTTAIATHPERILTMRQIKSFQSLVSRATKAEPLAYLLGNQPFYGFDFFVSPAVLIPRPESEWLVERALEALHDDPRLYTLIDVGTGSGCIIISILKKISEQKRGTINAYAVESSKRALDVAKRNALANHVTVDWRHGDLLTPLLDLLQKQRSPVLLVANLPYLTSRDYRNAPLSVRRYEPERALVAGRDGLDHYARLVEQIARLPHLAWELFWEIDPCHSTKLETLMINTFPKGVVNIDKDMNGFDRYLTAHIPIRVA